MMTEELSDVLLLLAWGVLGLLILLFWLCLATCLGMLIGKMIKGPNRKVPVEDRTLEFPAVAVPTEPMAFYRMPPTDTVEMSAVSR